MDNERTRQKQQVWGSARRKLTPRRAFLKAARNAQQLATEARRAASMVLEAAKGAHKHANDAFRAAKKAVRAAQRALLRIPMIVTTDSD